MAGIYIHVPFCKQACHYCNFHFSTNPALQNDFTGALLKEIAFRQSYLDGERIETIYFGGGTPSVLPAQAIQQMLDAIFQHFDVSPGAEITLEANPDDMQDANLLAWKQGGINRLSIGIQSFFTEDLIWMNRAHDGQQANLAVEKAQSAGFGNFSLDLIYGSPGLTDEKWTQNLLQAIALQPPHISAYALTVEPKTALFKMIQSHRIENVEPDQQARQFLAGIQLLEEAGYEHYEISSFAKPGNRSRHNTAYWHSKKYLGLGPSAHSYDGSSRQWNVSNNAAYIRSLRSGSLEFESEKLSAKDVLNEYIMTSLRTMEGLNLQHVSGVFGEPSSRRLKKESEKYIGAEKMQLLDERLILTRQGKLFADGIAASLFVD